MWLTRGRLRLLLAGNKPLPLAAGDKRGGRGMRFSATIIGMAVAAAFGFGASVAQADEPLNIRIAWVVPVGNWASIIYEKKDLMTHYGKTYTVTPTHFAGTPPMITALASGDLDIA